MVTSLLQQGNSFFLFFVDSLPFTHWLDPEAQEPTFFLPVLFFHVTSRPSHQGSLLPTLWLWLSFLFFCNKQD